MPCEGKNGSRTRWGPRERAGVVYFQTLLSGKDKKLSFLGAFEQAQRKAIAAGLLEERRYRSDFGGRKGSDKSWWKSYETLVKEVKCMGMTPAAELSEVLTRAEVLYKKQTEVRTKKLRETRAKKKSAKAKFEVKVEAVPSVPPAPPEPAPLVPVFERPTTPVVEEPAVEPPETPETPKAPVPEVVDQPMTQAQAKEIIEQNHRTHAQNLMLLNQGRAIESLILESIMGVQEKLEGQKVPVSSKAAEALRRTKIQKILVINTMGQQKEELLEEFGDVFDLRIYVSGKELGSRIKDICNQTDLGHIFFFQFGGHPAYHTAKGNKSGKPVHVGRSLSWLRTQLYGVLQGKDPHSQFDQRIRENHMNPA